VIGLTEHWQACWKEAWRKAQNEDLERGDRSFETGEPATSTQQAQDHHMLFS